MKKLILLLLVIVVISCSKQNESKIDHTSGLLGRWKYSEYFMSPGDAGKWYPVEEEIYLNLNADGTAGGNYFDKKISGFNTQFIEKVNGYVDSIIIFKYDDKTTLRNRFSLIDNKLLLSPYDVICIEGCMSKLIKVN